MGTGITLSEISSVGGEKGLWLWLFLINLRIIIFYKYTQLLAELETACVK